MPMSRVYVGNLPTRVNERDLEHFFKGFGKIRDVMLKNGFGFVEFDDSRDAEDAVYEQNGRELCGHRVVVEISRRSREDGGRGRYDNNRGYDNRGGGFGGYRSGGGGNFRREGGRGNGRFPPPRETRHKMIVQNLSTRFSWQDLKDMMRASGEGEGGVTYAEAHKRVRNEANVCFATHEDLRRAMEKFQGKEINGRRIKLIDDSEGAGSGKRRRSMSRSRSRSRSSRSASVRRSASARRSASRSRSSSPVKNGADEGSRSPPPKQSRSRSRSAGSASGSEK
jgi:arginine/serine-rich splicing factor 4/5/6